MISKTEIEQALSRGNLWAAMRNGRFWVLRRNGATQLWKTRPTEFSIPIKAGLNSCSRLTHADNVGRTTDANWRRADFVICETDPNSIKG